MAQAPDAEEAASAGGVNNGNGYFSNHRVRPTSSFERLVTSSHCGTGRARLAQDRTLSSPV